MPPKPAPKKLILIPKKPLSSPSKQTTQLPRPSDDDSSDDLHPSTSKLRLRRTGKPSPPPAGQAPVELDALPQCVVDKSVYDPTWNRIYPLLHIEIPYKHFEDLPETVKSQIVSQLEELKSMQPFGVFVPEMAQYTNPFLLSVHSSVSFIYSIEYKLQ